MNTYSSNDRQKRIEDLEGSISRREDDRELRDTIVELKVLGIPGDLFDNIFVFDELYSRFSEHEDLMIRSIFMDWIDAYLGDSIENKNKSIARIVLENIEKTLNSDRVLLMGDIKSDSAYKILEDLKASIWRYPNTFENEDQIIQDMRREWASDFIVSTQEVFRNRGGVIDNNEFWIECIAPISLQELYEILDKISRNKSLQDEVFKRICTILPSCPGQEFDWRDIESIITEITDK